jgi:hypothetical protein
MIYFSLKYIMLLVIVVNECITKTVNDDNLQLKFIFIVSILIIFLRFFLPKIMI